MRAHGVCRAILSGIALAVFGVLFAQQTPYQDPEVFAIVGATVVPVEGQPIVDATLVVRGGSIVALGASASTRVPADAEVIDGKGKFVYPAFIDAYTSLGMPDSAAWDLLDRGNVFSNNLIRPERVAGDLFVPVEADLRARWRLGFGIANLALPNGLFSGQTSAVSLAPGSPEERLLADTPFGGLHLSGGRDRPSQGYGFPGSLMGRIALARQALLDAQRQARGRADTMNRSLAALEPALSGRQTLIADAETGLEVSRLMKLADEFGLRLVIAGGSRAVEASELLSQKESSVLVRLSPPTVAEAYDSDQIPTLTSLRLRDLTLQNPALLESNGLLGAIVTGRSPALASFWNDLRTQIRYGLKPASALEALTIRPARLLGLQSRYGSLKVGKAASLLLSSAEFGSREFRPERVFLDGIEVKFERDQPGGGGQGRGEDDFQPGEHDHVHFEGDGHDHSGDSHWDAGRVIIGTSCCNIDLTSGAQKESFAAAIAKAVEPQEDAAAAKEPEPALPSVRFDPVLPTPTDRADDWLIRGATVWTVTGSGVLRNTDVLIVDGEIAQIGTGIAPGNATVIEANGRHLVPGIIDCHSHIAISGGVNEGSNAVTSEVRIADVINPRDPSIYRQLAGGTTAANLLHGSANVIGGQNAVIRFKWGQDADAMLEDEAPQGIKFALGENVTQVSSRGRRTNTSTPARYPYTRMGVQEVIEERFAAALEYRQAWREFEAGTRDIEPRKDLQLEAIAEILEGTRLVHCHSYQQSEILMLMRLAERFGLTIGTFQHVLEGYKVANELAVHGAGASSFTDWWAFKWEAYGAIPYSPHIMWDRGVNVSLNSDDAELGGRLNIDAAKAVRYGGVPEAEALKMVTLNPAIQLGIDHLVGSIEVGKRADLALFDSHPLSVYSECELTFVDGVKVFDREIDLLHREAIEAERRQRLGDARIESVLPPADLPEAADLAPTYRSEDERRNDGSEVVAIVGGRVHRFGQPFLENATILVEGGKIVALGSDVVVPSGAKVVDATGKTVYPALIDAMTPIGLTEVEQVPASGDRSEQGPYSPNAEAVVAFDADSEYIAVTRANGVGTVVSAPAGGSLAGAAAVMNLDGYNWEEMAIRPRLGMVASIPAPSVDPGQSRAARRNGWELALQSLSEFVASSRRYMQAREAAAADGEIPYHERDVRYEAMIPVLKGEIPLLASANSPQAIKAAIYWAHRENLKLVIVGGTQADEVADVLVKYRVPVILTGVYRLPGTSDEGYDDAMALPARLKAAGVKFCISTNSAMNSRNLPFHAGRAAAFGLSWEDALRSVTQDAADILGLGHRLGSIEVGKDANLIVVSGDPLEVRSGVDAMLIAGRVVDLSSLHTRLRDRYGNRPRD